MNFDQLSSSSSSTAASSASPRAASASRRFASRDASASACVPRTRAARQHRGYKTRAARSRAPGAPPRAAGPRRREVSRRGRASRSARAPRAPRRPRPAPPPSITSCVAAMILRTPVADVRFLFLPVLLGSRRHVRDGFVRRYPSPLVQRSRHPLVVVLVIAPDDGALLRRRRRRASAIIRVHRPNESGLPAPARPRCAAHASTSRPMMIRAQPSSLARRLFVTLTKPYAPRRLRPRGADVGAPRSRSRGATRRASRSTNRNLRTTHEKNRETKPRDAGPPRQAGGGGTRHSRCRRRRPLASARRTCAIS